MRDPLQFGAVFLVTWITGCETVRYMPHPAPQADRVSLEQSASATVSAQQHERADLLERLALLEKANTALKIQDNMQQAQLTEVMTLLADRLDELQAKQDRMQIKLRSITGE